MFLRPFLIIDPVLLPVIVATSENPALKKSLTPQYDHNLPNFHPYAQAFAPQRPYNYKEKIITPVRQPPYHCQPYDLTIEDQGEYHRDIYDLTLKHRQSYYDSLFRSSTLRPGPCNPTLIPYSPFNHANVYNQELRNVLALPTFIV